MLPQREMNERIDKLFNTYSYHNYRPKWLRNPLTDNKLEIDFYYPKFKIGFEYNGAYHFDESRSDHDYIKFKDTEKIKICRKNKVDLIVLTKINLKMDDLRLLQFIFGNIRNKQKKEFIHILMISNLKNVLMLLEKYRNKVGY